MATVTQLASGYSDSTTLFTLSGITYNAGDVILGFSQSYADCTQVYDDVSGGYGRASQRTSASTNWGTYFVRTPTVSTASTTLYLDLQTTTACAVVVWRIQPDAGKVLSRPGGTISSGYSTSFSTTISNVTETSIVFGAHAVADNVYATDSDTLNGSWSSVFAVSTGTGTDRAVASQYKAVTLGGDQTYGGTFSGGGTEYFVAMTYHLLEGDIGYWGMKA